MITKITKHTYQYLKDHHTMIHYFGLGFIQIKLGTTYRMHIYTPQLPKIVGDEEIHDHRYDFTSSILYGKLHQTLYKITEGTSHLLQNESCNKNIQASQSITHCGVQTIGRQTFAQGSSYSIPHDIFHTIEARYCITLLRRSQYKKELAHVVRPKTASKVCPFSKAVDEETLWNIVRSTLDEVLMGNGA